jgi:hypothetical protein
MFLRVFIAENIRGRESAHVSLVFPQGSGRFDGISTKRKQAL